MTEAIERAGGCLCGAVRFRVRHGGEVVLCHCSMCRRMHGGPLFAVMCEGAPTFEAEGAVGVYRSSEQGERGFCQNCGSTLYFRHRAQDFFAFTAGSFDDQAPMMITGQIHLDDKPGFYAFASDTPGHRKDEESEPVGPAQPR